MISFPPSKSLRPPLSPTLAFFPPSSLSLLSHALEILPQCHSKRNEGETPGRLPQESEGCRKAGTLGRRLRKLLGRRKGQGEAPWPGTRADTLPSAGWRHSLPACPSFSSPLPGILTFLSGWLPGHGDHSLVVGCFRQSFPRVGPLLSAELWLIRGLPCDSPGPGRWHQDPYLRSGLVLAWPGAGGGITRSR